MEQQEQNHPLIQTKTKRDQFLVDIRKEKTQNIIHSKRLKLSQTNFSPNNPFIIVELPEHQVSPIFDPNDPDNFEIPIPYGIQCELQQKRDEFFEAYHSEKWEDLLQVIQTLREAMGMEHGYVTPKIILDMGIISSVLHLLSEKFSKISKLQSEAAWFIANVASGHTQVVVALVEENSIPILVDCLDNDNEELHENAMWALANIAGETFFDMRSKILEAGILKRIHSHFCKTSKQPNYYRTAMWLLHNLIKKPSPPFDKVSGMLSSIVQLITYSNEEIRELVLECLLYFSEIPKNETYDMFKALGIIPKIIPYIENKNRKVAFNALKITGNLARAQAYIVLELIKNDVFHFLLIALKDEKAEFRKEACFALCNILLDKQDGHDPYIDNTIMPAILDIMKNDHPMVKYEATSCVTIFLKKSSVSEAQLLVSGGVIEILLENLLENNHVKLLKESLNALDLLFAIGEQIRQGYDQNPYSYRAVTGVGAKLIEDLQFHKDPDVYETAASLIGDYFHHEEIQQEFE